MITQSIAIVDCKAAIAWFRDEWKSPLGEGFPRKQPSTKSKQTAYAGNGGLSGAVDVELVKDALTFIKLGNDDRDKWFNILCGLKHGGISFEIGDEWSSKQPKYEGADDVKATWNSIKPRGPEDATLGTVFHYAKEAGWIDPRKKRSNAKVKKLVRDKTMSTATEGKNGDEDTNIDRSELELARKTLKTFGEGNSIFAQSQFFEWSGKVWVDCEDEQIKQKIIKICEEVNAKLFAAGHGRECFEIKAGKIESIFKLMKTLSAVISIEFDKPSEIINVDNGELVFKNDRWILTPHRRESYRLTLIPTAYDPTAQAPRFERFITEIFADDEDRNEKRECILQFLGYSLTNNCKYEASLFIIGEGSNGKSRLLFVVRNLLGQHHVTAIDPSKLKNDYSLAHLRGKLVNIIPEIEKGLVLNDGIIKTLTSGELVNARNPYGRPFDFCPYAKPWFGANDVPHTKDLTHGFFRKIRLIKFNQTYRDQGEPDWKEGNKPKDLTIDDQHLKEMPGILNLALNALVVARKQGFITDPLSSQQAKSNWRRDSDMAALFVDDYCKTGVSCMSRMSDLFEGFKEWASKAGITKPLTSNGLSRRLTSLGYDKCDGTNRVRMRKNIEIDYERIRANQSGYMSQGT